MAEETKNITPDSKNLPVENQTELAEIPEKPAVQKPVREAKTKPDPRAKLYNPGDRPYIVTSSPHAAGTDSVPKIMWSVIAALAPALLLSIYYFRVPAFLLMMVCILSACGTEYIITRIRKQEGILFDGSAVLTGLLLALTLPPSLPLTSAALGSIFAIAVGKQIFGGLGYNIFNPALLGRAFLQASFPVAMTTWTLPGTGKYAGIDAVSAATPLGQFKFENILPDHLDLLTGNIGGSLGETSAIALLIGGLFLLFKRYADWRIPVSYLGTVFVLSAAFWLYNKQVYPDPLFYLLSGGLMLGAFFMATDMVTSPITTRGAWIYGFGAGILLVVIRLFGGLPEGVMYSILLMNAVTPLINRWTRPAYFGELRG